MIFSTGAAGTLATASTLGAAVALATNGALGVNITAEWSVANAGNQAVLESLIVDVL